MNQSRESHGRAFREGGFIYTELGKDRAVQSMEGVHLSLIPKVGNETYRAFIEGCIYRGCIYGGFTVLINS